MSKKFFARALAVASLMALTSALAGPTAAETLGEAIALAYQTNPGMQAQRAAMRALDENYTQARAAFGVNASVQASETYTELRRGPGEATAYNPTVGVSIAQPVYTGGRLHAQLTAAEAEVMAGRQSLRRFELDLLQRVITAYVGVRRDQETLRISQDTASVMAQQLSDTEAKFEVRQVTATDVAQSKARLASARSQVISAEGQLAITRAQYLAVVGKNPEDLAPEPPLEGVPATIDQAFDAGENSNPSLLGAGFQEQASRARVAEAKASGMPNVSVRVDIRRSPYLPYQGGIFDNTISATAVVSQPIFTSGLIASQVRQSLEQNNRDRMSIEDARRNMIQGVAQAWESLAASRRALVTQEDEAKQNETAFYGVREEEKVGLRSTLEILNAALELQQAQLSLVRGRFNEYVSRAQLLAAMGALSAKTLAPGIDLYDPATNFNRVRNRGAMPWEAPVRILDGVGGIPISQPKPAVTPMGRPDETNVLPPAPVAASETPPITSISEVMERTRGVPEAPETDAPVTTAPAR